MLILMMISNKYFDHNFGHIFNVKKNEQNIEHYNLAVKEYNEDAL